MHTVTVSSFVCCQLARCAHAHHMSILSKGRGQSSNRHAQMAVSQSCTDLKSYCDRVVKENQWKLDEQIDFQHGGIATHLGKIADAINEWEGRTAEELGLSKVDVSAIKTRHPDNLELQTRDALHRWQEKNGLEATYRNLIDAFLKAGKASFAEAVCNVLGVEHETHEFQSGEAVAQLAVARSQAVTPRTEDSEVQKTMIMEAKIRKSFGHFKREVLRVLKEKPIDMEEFVEFVKSEFPSQVQAIAWIPAESEKISTIFDTITSNALWCYLRYTHLKNIAEEFAKKETEHLIDSYEKELVSFKAATKIADYVALCQDEEDIADPDEPLAPNPAKYNKEYFKKLTMKLGVRVTNETLQHIDDLWKAVAKFFGLPPLLPLLDRIVAGSLVIIWFIPHHFAMKIRANSTGSEAEAFFIAHQIIEVKIDDDCLYHYEATTSEDTKSLSESAIMVELQSTVSDSEDDCFQREAASLMDEQIAQVPWHERVDPEDTNTPDVMETTNHGSESELTQQEPFSVHVGIQASNTEPQASLPAQPRPQTKKVGTDHEKRKFLDVILKAVIGGHQEPIKSAIQMLNEHCDIQQNPVGLQPLDFFPQAKSPTDIYVPEAYSCHSPLMIACEKERADLVKLLLGLDSEQRLPKASAAFRNKDKLNALHIACKKGNVVIVDLLLEAAGREKRFCKIKKHPSDLEWMLNARNERGWNPLMFAVDGGHIDVVKRLIKTGHVNYRCKNRKQCNILHIASRQTNLECVEEVLSLCDKDAELATELILASDKSGWNILHHACANKNNVNVLELLLRHLSEDNRTQLINQQNKVGYTPLLTACEYQNKTAVELLFAHGADVTLCAMDKGQQKGQKSGLHIAAIHDAKDIAELLLTNKCPLGSQDSEGNSPLHVAYKKSSFEVIAVLRQRDDGKLETLTNKAGVLARNITPDDIIPPEIKKRGKEAIDLYKKALKEGKMKIPRCNLLILGQERVGKTSVYRLLVGLGFKAELDSTKGIDNSVDTLDKRYMDIDHWKERSEEVQKEQSKELFADGVVGEVRDKLPPKKKGPKRIKPVYEDQLMREVQSIKAEIERKTREASTPAVDALATAISLMDISRTTTHIKPPPAKHTAPISAPPPRKIAPTKLAPIKERSESRIVEPQREPVPHPEPTPKVDPAEPPSTEIVPIVNREHRHSISQQLKKNMTTKKKDPPLILNTLDFAGQVEYRPMHHCFITRRGMYLVVFNLQDMVKYIDSRNGGNVDENPLEEVRYWLHSIHAHIYPPDNIERGRDEKMRRTCLVGTHRAPRDPEQGREITKDELKAINKLLTDELLSDDRCVDHIHIMEGSEWIFVAVENSIDSRNPKEREDSGAYLLQRNLKSISSHLIYLEEDYPIIWLQFESELMRYREDYKRRNLSMVIELEELKHWAYYLGSPETQHLAFQFFHDTGKIVYLRQTPTLFLNDEERDQLTDLVILDPAWLIKVMKVIFELKLNSFQEVPGRLVRDLNATGKASSTLLKACWEEFTDTNPVSFHQLCLMLQANCLIYPVPAPSVLPPLRAETDPLPSSSPLPTVPARSQTSPQDNDTEKFFLVPCKLPEKPSEVTKPGLPWIEFYFDFQKFLPNEIFHRLICLMLADPESKKSKKNTYYNTCCQFHNIDGCKWKIELEKNMHRLKVSVLLKEGDERPPRYFIEKAHTEYLLKICQDSNLQGLEYYGGPLVKCDCGEEEIVEFVGYAHGMSEKSLCDELWCTNCPKKHDINELLKSQAPVPVVSRVDLPPTTKVTFASAMGSGRSKVSRSLMEEELDSSTSLAAQNTTTLPSSTCTSSPQAGARDEAPLSPNPPTLKNLTIIKWKDAKGEDQKPLRIMRTLAPKWREVGVILGSDRALIDSISMKHYGDPIECCCEIFMKWLDGACSEDYPVTWAGLIELLVDMKLKHLANNLERALQPEISVTIKDETGRSKVSRSLVEEELDSSTSLAAQNTTILPSSTSSPQAGTRDKAPSSNSNQPTLRDLTIIKWKDAKGEDQTPLRIMHTLAPEWREVGVILGSDRALIDSISSKREGNLGDCCYEIFTKWLDGVVYCKDYPVTWDGLIGLLLHMEEKQLADNLEKALQFLKIHTHTHKHEPQDRYSLPTSDDAQCTLQSQTFSRVL